MRNIPIQLAVVSLVLCTSAVDSKPPGGLCLKTETARFSCEAAGGKVISLCESGDLGFETGTLKYRYGRPGSVELEFPSESGQGLGLFHKYFRPWSRVSGNEEHRVGFWIGDWQYEVYEILDVSNGYEDQYGVRVTRTGGVPVTIECQGAPEVNRLDELRDEIPDG